MTAKDIKERITTEIRIPLWAITLIISLLALFLPLLVSVINNQGKMIEAHARQRLDFDAFVIITREQISQLRDDKVNYRDFERIYTKIDRLEDKLNGIENYLKER